MLKFWNQEKIHCFHNKPHFLVIFLKLLMYENKVHTSAPEVSLLVLLQTFVILC